MKPKFSLVVATCTLLVATTAGCNSENTSGSDTGVTATASTLTGSTHESSGTIESDPSTSESGVGEPAVVAAPDGDGPIDQLIFSRTGMTMREIREALDQQIDERIIACTAARGVTVSEDDLPPGPSEVEQVAFGGAVRAIREQTAALISGSGPVRAAAEQAVFDECLVSSTADPDPLLAFFDWLDLQTTEANARMESDPRILDARQAAQSCLTERGYSADVSVLRGQFVDDAQTIVDRARTGEISGDEANAQLDILEADEDHVTGIVAPCIAGQLETEQTVRHELEQTVIDDDGEAINEQLDNLSAELREAAIEPE